MLKKLLIGAFLSVIILLNSFSPVLAVIVFTISDPVVGADDEVEVNASISGLISSSCSADGCYLQAQIRVPDESKGFFGYTYNNSGEFVNYFSQASSTDEIKTKLFNFVPVSGAWSGKLKAKNNPIDSNYIGPGQYVLKFRRFSGNSVNPTSGDSNPISINFAAATPSPTPGPTPAPTAAPTAAPTTTPAPTKTPTPVPTKTPSPTPTKTATPTPEATVLAGSTEENGGTSSPSPTAIGGESSAKKLSFLPFLLIGGGVFCLGFAGYSVFKNSKTGYNSQSDAEEKSEEEE